LTVATAALDVDQSKVVADAGGLAVAVSCTVPPTATVALEGETLIDLTLFGFPPFANDGDSGAVGMRRSSIGSEQLIAITTRLAPMTNGVRLRIGRGAGEGGPTTGYQCTPEALAARRVTS
jgi:hypothetical protein